MKKGFSNEQIMSIFREAEAGISAREFFRGYPVTIRTSLGTEFASCTHSALNYQAPSELAARWRNGKSGVSEQILLTDCCIAYCARSEGFLVNVYLVPRTSKVSRLSYLHIRCLSTP